MNVAGCAENLAQALKELRIEWERVGGYWRDAKRDEFEHKYLETLPNDVPRAALVVKEIAAVLERVRKDCE
ncbi:MAG: hypothetical protein ABMA13_11250 [Chthoniobacteraceae bacterium]